MARADDDAWVVQGRPSAGVQPGQADDRLVTALPYRFLVDSAQLTVRYVRMSGSCASLGEGGYIRANTSAVITVEKVFFGGAGGSAPISTGTARLNATASPSATEPSCATMSALLATGVPLTAVMREPSATPTFCAALSAPLNCETPPPAAITVPGEHVSEAGSVRMGRLQQRRVAI